MTVDCDAGTSYAYTGIIVPRIPALAPNTIPNNGGHGINIERVSGAWIVGNTIGNNKGSGVAVNRSSQAVIIASVIDAKSGEIKLLETPIPDTAPRRGMADSKDRLWVALNKTDRVAMFDPKTEKFQTWSLGIPEYYAYDVWADRNGEARASTEYADRVVRINPATGEIIRYLLPGETYMRRANGDNTSKPVNFWVGATHTAFIVRPEPLE